MKIERVKSLFFEKINETDEPLARLIIIKKIQITNISSGTCTVVILQILKRIIR